MVSSFRFSDENSNDYSIRKEDTTNAAFDEIFGRYTEWTDEKEKETELRGKIDYTWPISEKTRLKLVISMNMKFH
ncbi:MAG: hypothetical protein HC906_12325 [Bacteroidales bacterium]|nr:hypothetical protein [Bacteroidales bacterium]